MRVYCGVILMTRIMRNEEQDIEFGGLVVRFWENRITDAELERLREALASSPERAREFRELQSLKELLERRDESRRFDAEAALADIRRRMRRQRRLVAWRWAAAACAALLLGAGGLFWAERAEVGVAPERTVVAERWEPQAGKAYLQVAEQAEVELAPDSVMVVGRSRRDTLPGEEGVGSVSGTDAEWYRLFTTTGAVYTVVLADGTRVWLNAESELRYPERFEGDSREVCLTGEGYFEVTKDAKRPFRVRLGDVTVEVLGTEFNARGYADEETLDVTLVSGGVRVLEEEREVARLKPSERVDVNVRTGDFRVSKADLGSVLAWKEGMFVFKNTPLEMILRQLSRWYGVEFSLDEGLAEGVYSGNISRFEPLERVLDIMRLTNEIEFVEVEKNKIEVIPKE